MIFLSVSESEKSPEGVADDSRMTSMDPREFLSPFSEDPRLTCSHLVDTQGHRVDDFGSSVLVSPYTISPVLYTTVCCW